MEINAANLMFLKIRKRGESQGMGEKKHAGQLVYKMSSGKSISDRLHG